MFAPRLSFTLALAFCLLAVEISAQDETKKPPPEPWQIAGIRAAFGDARVPFPERSAEVQETGSDARRAGNEWGAALDPQEAAVYLKSTDAIFYRLQVISVFGQMGKAGARFTKELAGLTCGKISGERKVTHGIRRLQRKRPSPEVYPRTRGCVGSSKRRTAHQERRQSLLSSKIKTARSAM